MAKSNNTYQENVLNVNANYKKVSKSLGAIRSALIAMDGTTIEDADGNEVVFKLPPFTKKVLTTMKKNTEAYQFVKAQVRKSKDGENTTVFYVLQKLGNKKFIEAFSQKFMIAKPKAKK